MRTPPSSTPPDSLTPLSSVEIGVIHYLYYPVEGMDKSQWLKVATTRPETILGDTAVAVHPDDPRYEAYHGKTAINPLTGRKIPIVLDSELVNMSLGTGVVKVTPAHDPEDYACGNRHNLEFINILNDDGSLNSNAGAAFQGMDRFDAREEIIRALEREGFYIEKKPNPMKIAICSRSKDILEPRLKPQWYVSCKEIGSKSLELVQSGEIEMLPETFRDEWERWMSSYSIESTDRRRSYRIVPRVQEGFATGASLDSCGGVIEFQHGELFARFKERTQKRSGLLPAAKRKRRRKRSRNFPSSPGNSPSNRMTMYWIHGSRLACFRYRHSAGRTTNH